MKDKDALMYEYESLCVVIDSMNARRNDLRQQLKDMGVRFPIMSEAERKEECVKIVLSKLEKVEEALSVIPDIKTAVKLM